MLTTLGSHEDRNLHNELTALQTKMTALTARIQDDHFHSPEARWNTHSNLDNLRRRHRALAEQTAMEDQRIRRLADAVRTVGDIELGTVAYVVFGPAALPMETLYEVRLVDADGYTVPDAVRSNLPADRVDAARQSLMDGPARDHATLWGYSVREYTVQVTPF